MNFWLIGKNKTGTQRPLLAEKRLEDYANLTGILTKSLKTAWCIVNNKQITNAVVKIRNIIHSKRQGKVWPQRAGRRYLAFRRSEGVRWLDHSPGEQKDNERNGVKSPVLLWNIKSQTKESSFYRFRRLTFQWSLL